MSRKTDHSDDSDSTQNFHRDDPQIGVCLQYLRFKIIASVFISTRLITPPPPPPPPPPPSVQLIRLPSGSRFGVQNSETDKHALTMTEIVQLTSYI